MEVIVPIGLMAVGVVILGIYLIIRFSRGLTQSAQVVLDKRTKLAEGLGLAYEPRTGRFLGSYLGRQVRVFIGDDEEGPCTSIQAELINPPSGTMEVRYVGYGGFKYVLDEVSKLLGAQDIEVGDPDFDRAFRIKGMPVFVHGVLSSAHLRQRLLELENWSSMRIREGKLFFRIYGFQLSVDYLSQLLDLVCEFAESVERIDYA